MVDSDQMVTQMICFGSLWPGKLKILVRSLQNKNWNTFEFQLQI